MNNLITKTVAIGAAFLSVFAWAGGYVADPYRAADVTWPKHECKGRTWRYLLTSDAQKLDAMKNEPFAQDAGYYQIYCPHKLEKMSGGNLFGFREQEPKHRFVITGAYVDAEMKKRMHDVPFQLFEGSRNIWDVTAEDCDLHVFDEFKKEYPDTFLGIGHAEWDAGLLWPMTRPSCEGFKTMMKRLPPNPTREDMTRFFCDYHDVSAIRRGNFVASHSGPCNLTHLACERGSTMAHIELTLDQSWRSMMMHTRSCGRQFNVPLEFYTAFYLFQYTASSRAAYANSGEDWGIAPALAYRTTLLAYYQGANYQSFECFPWAFAKEVEKKVKDQGQEKTVKTTVLTQNGKYLKKAYDFIRGPDGARGEHYAPILLLADWAHGHDCLNNRISSEKPWGPYANFFAPTVFDQFYQDVIDVIAPTVPNSSPWSKWNADHEWQFGLVNSDVSDIFNVYIANPSVKEKALTADQLAKHSVVMSLGGIRWTDELKALVAGYVAAGGTFVNVEGEIFPAISKKIGHGNVLTAPRDKAKLAAFLRNLQREVLPMEVKTTCELVWNVMPDGSWRVCAANNAGVEKPGNVTKETYHPECDKEITFVAPKGRKIEVRELLEHDAPAKGMTWKVPAGLVRVFEIRGLDVHGKKFDMAGVSMNPCEAPYEFPLDFKHVEKGDYYAACIKADYDTDEATVECWAKPQPLEAWKATGRKILEGSPFMVGTDENSVGTPFGPCWLNGRWCLKRGIDQGAQWIKGPEADPAHFTKLAVTLKDGVLHFFVDDKEVFGEEGPLLHPSGTPKCRFYNRFDFWKGASSFRLGHKYLGEVKDCHAYSKALYPLRHEVAKCGDGDDTAAVQKAIDAAVEKTGEVVVKKGTYKVSQLLLRTGVTLHLEEGASIVHLQPSPSPILVARDVADFTIVGPGTVAGDVVLEKAERGCMRRLKMANGKLVLKEAKNVVVEKCEGVEIDAKDSSRILVDGKLLK